MSIFGSMELFFFSSFFPLLFCMIYVYTRHHGLYMLLFVSITIMMHKSYNWVGRKKQHKMRNLFNEYSIFLNNSYHNYLTFDFDQVLIFFFTDLMVLKNTITWNFYSMPYRNQLLSCLMHFLEMCKRLNLKLMKCDFLLQIWRSPYLSLPCIFERRN